MLQKRLGELHDTVMDGLVRRRLRGSVFAVVALLWLAAEAWTALHAVFHKETAIFDWDAYMEQAALIERGERNYSLIRGDTGPLVYGGGHVAIHVALKGAFGWDHERWTTEKVINGTSTAESLPERTHQPVPVIRRIQLVYVALYLATLAVVGWLYYIVGISWLWMPLTLATIRLRNIYGMGLFNDGWGMLLAYAGVAACAEEAWTVAAVLLSLGCSVKMNVMLFLPAFVWFVWNRQGWRGLVTQGAVGAAVQLVVAAPFLLVAPVDYIAGAFNLGRSFEQRWSVNWQMLPPWLFSSRLFHTTLLIGHLATLVRLGVTHGPAFLRSGRAGVVRAMLLCNFVGVAFARSLHYQFFAWYALSLPVLCGSGAFHEAAGLALYIAAELAWNVHEPTAASAALLTVTHVLILLGQWMDVPQGSSVSSGIVTAGRRSGGSGVSSPARSRRRRHDAAWLCSAIKRTLGCSLVKEE